VKACVIHCGQTGQTKVLIERKDHCYIHNGRTDNRGPGTIDEWIRRIASEEGYSQRPYGEPYNVVFHRHTAQSTAGLLAEDADYVEKR